MSKPILFVIHGMGTPTKKWTDDSIKKPLNAAMSEIDFFNKSRRKNIQDRLRIVPLSYNQFFEKQRKRWSDDATSVINLLEAKTKTELTSHFSDAETTFLKKQKGVEKDTFFNTHILDVLLYRFTDIGEQVRRHVAYEMIDTLFRYEEPSYNILAYSLGTSVIHDTLHALCNSRWRKEHVTEDRFSLKAYKASNLIMISNVSRVLQASDKKNAQAYKSVVRPGKGGVCKYMLNITHDYDPIAKTKEFKPSEIWLDGKEGIFKQLSPEYVTEKNTHSITNYLNNPNVNQEILSRLVTPRGRIAFQRGEKNKILNTYKSKTLHMPEYFAKLSGLKSDNPQSRQLIIEKWKLFSELLKLGA